MKDFWTKESLTHVPEGSVIHGLQALLLTNGVKDG